MFNGRLTPLVVSTLCLLAFPLQPLFLFFFLLDWHYLDCEIGGRHIRNGSKSSSVVCKQDGGDLWGGLCSGQTNCRDFLLYIRHMNSPPATTAATATPIVTGS